MSFTVYKSSAGSGKTYTLVLEYLRLVLPDPPAFRSVLAITFTNKAANEMKERVLKNLKILSDPADNGKEQLLKQLVDLTGLPAEIISLNAGEVLGLILHNYSDFAIGTIDAFSHRIVRSFARDFGLPVNFLVTLESGTLRQTAVDMLLNRAGEDKDLTRLLVRFLETMIDENNGWDIGRIIFNFSKVLEDEESGRYLEKLRSLSFTDFQEISHHFYIVCNELQEKIAAPGIKAMKLIEENGIPENAFFQGTKGFYGYMKRIASGRFDKVEENSYVRRTLEEGKWFSGSATAADKESIMRITEDLLNCYEDFKKLSADSLPVMNLINLLKKTIYPLGVLNMIDALFSEFKKQKNVVQVAEFNRRISKVVSTEPVPFVYERIGERFRHILIDEFQDTSRMQWENLLPLVENALSSGSFNLVVGDGKQAIYRWRNGDVDQFVSLPEIPGSAANPVLKTREASLRNHIANKSLDHNYRSFTNVVEFNNSFFGFVKSEMKPANGGVYEGYEQKADQKKTGGYVSVEFIPKEGITAFTQERILEIINTLKENNYQYSDIAILCRNNARASETATFLMQQGINVVSAESLLLSYSEEVLLLINLLKYINENDVVFIQADIITSLLSKNKIQGSLPELLHKLDSRKGFRDILKENGYTLNDHFLATLPLYDLCEELIRIFRLNEHPDAYIQFFLDAVLEFSRQNPNEINLFLEWWEQNKIKLSVVVPEGIDAVNVMTIHKAKGLEFPAVIYPYACQAIRAGKNYLWIDLPQKDFHGLPVAMVKPEKALAGTSFAPQYEEEMQRSELDLINLLYVAMTRAEEALFILTENPSKETEALSIPCLLKKYFQVREEWYDDVQVYPKGDLVRRNSEKKKNDAELLTSFISSDYRKKIRIRTNSPASWDVNDPQKKRLKGNLLHSFLSSVKTAADIDGVIDNALHTGLIDIESSENYRSMLKNLVSHPDAAPYFADGIKVLNETEILSKEGNSYRPDRIIINNGKAMLMDYKTGKSEDHHRQQLRNYGVLLSELGYEVSKNLILYMEPAIKIVEV